MFSDSIARLAAAAAVVFASTATLSAQSADGVLAVANGELAHGNPAGALSLLSEARTQGNPTGAPLLSDPAYWSSLGTAHLCAEDDLEQARLCFRHARSLGLLSLPAQPCRNAELQSLFAMVLAEGTGEAVPEAPSSPTPEAIPSPEVVTAASVEDTQPQDLPIIDDATDEAASDAPIDDDTPATADEPDAAADSTPWLEAGLVAGIGWVGEGLPTDRDRPAIPSGTEAWQNCDSRGQNCEVRVRSPGAAAGLGLRIAAAFPLRPNLHLGFGVRLHSAGEGLLAGVLFEALARWEIWRRGKSHIGAGVNLGVGQIQYQPPQQELQDLGIEAPYARSGLGWAGASLTLAYDFLPGFALYGELTPRVSFPEVLPVLDVGIGVRVSPGVAAP